MQTKAKHSIYTLTMIAVIDVYKRQFVDSRNFFTPEFRDLYAVDYLHPNDLGQMSMAQVIFPAVQAAVFKKK